MEKDAGLRIRVQRALREQFVAACKAEDKPAAQVIREFMRDYIERHAVDAADDSGLAKDKTNRTKP